MVDTGIGFDPDQPSRGYGIQLMRGLARQLRGELELKRLANGMLVRLAFPQKAP